jgi:hypothetical protein
LGKENKHTHKTKILHPIIFKQKVSLNGQSFEKESKVHVK